MQNIKPFDAISLEEISKILGEEVSGSFNIYLLGAFTCGFCVCMLNTVVNPMLNLLGGGGNKGNLSYIRLKQAGFRQEYP